MKLLVAGVARSGTTLMYESVTRRAATEVPGVQFRYEPYLWAHESPRVAGQDFTTDGLSPHGIYVQTATPLFLAGRHDLHDAWLQDRLLLGTDASVVTKVIRGSGRLEAMLTFDDELAIVAIVRNPLDTINSIRPRFSFFGHEFHPSDQERFLDQAEELGVAPVGDSFALRSAAWWQAMTAAMLDVASRHRERVLLLPYEYVVRAPVEAGTAITELVDGQLGQGAGILNLAKQSGPRTSSNYLTGSEVRSLGDAYSWYEDSVLHQSGAPWAGIGDEVAVEVTQTYSRLRTAKVTVSSDARFTASQMRSRMQRFAPTPSTLRARLDAVSRLLGDDAVPGRGPGWISSRSGPVTDVGLVIAAHNAAGTIRDTLLSCLNQSEPYAEIVVVDDASSDRTGEIVHEVAAQDGRVRLLRIDDQTGPAFARDTGIRSLSTEFFATVDADDLLWPWKNESEVAMLRGARSIAFSDVVLERSTGVALASTAPFAAPGLNVLRSLAARRGKVPRDMVLARALYVEAGGFDPRLGLFEDWDLKMRLAALPAVEWSHSPTPGTLYDRIVPGLSATTSRRLLQSIIFVFAKNRHLFQIEDEAFNGLVLEGVAKLGLPELSQLARILADRPWTFSLNGPVLRSRSFLAANSDDVLSWLAGTAGEEAA